MQVNPSLHHIASWTQGKKTRGVGYRAAVVTSKAYKQDKLFFKASLKRVYAATEDTARGHFANF